MFKEEKQKRISKKNKMPIFYYAFHSSKQTDPTDKLPIIVHSYTRILLKPDKDAIREGDFEGMGLKHFREKFRDIDIVYFFMPPVLRVRMPVAIAQVCIIPEDKFARYARRICNPRSEKQPQSYKKKKKRKTGPSLREKQEIQMNSIG